MNLASLSFGEDINWDWQEVPKHPDSDDHDMKEDKQSLSGANEQKEEDEMVAAIPSKSAPATECSPLTIIEKMETLFL